MSATVPTNTEFLALKATVTQAVANIADLDRRLVLAANRIQALEDAVIIPPVIPPVPPPVVVPPVVPPVIPPPTGTLPRILNDNPWTVLRGNGWDYMLRTSPNEDRIITDLTAPEPPSFLRIGFPTSMQPNTEPSVHWMPLHGETEIETEWRGRLSPNWTSSPAGAGKITFVMASGGGQVYTNYYHQGGTPETGWTPGPPYRLGINTEWAPYGQKVWLPNMTPMFIPLDSWVTFLVYYKWASAPGVADGVIRWSINGVLNGEYRNVEYPGSRGFTEFQYAPTRQNVPPTEQWMDIDHTVVRVP